MEVSPHAHSNHSIQIARRSAFTCVLSVSVYMLKSVSKTALKSAVTIPLCKKFAWSLRFALLGFLGCHHRDLCLIGRSLLDNLLLLLLLLLRGFDVLQCVTGLTLWAGCRSASPVRVQQRVPDSASAIKPGLGGTPL